MNPMIMVAPNGARKTKADHQALPITPKELADEAVACVKAGATAYHVHVRDEAEKHSLDAGRYREALAEIRAAVGDQMLLQVTSELAGVFQKKDIVQLAETLVPEYMSVAVREIAPSEADEAEAKRFYADCLARGTRLQHIVYSPEDLARFARLWPEGEHASVLFVLGRYSTQQLATPADLLPFIQTLNDSHLAENSAWTICAFGRTELASLTAAAILGGHCRIGFENSCEEPDGSVSHSNGERVKTLNSLLSALGAMPGDIEVARRVLG